MAQPKLTPMQFMRKYCKHEPSFASPHKEQDAVVAPNMVIAARVPVKAKVA